MEVHQLMEARQPMEAASEPAAHHCPVQRRRFRHPSTARQLTPGRSHRRRRRWGHRCSIRIRPAPTPARMRLQCRACRRYRRPSFRAGFPVPIQRRTQACLADCSLELQRAVHQSSVLAILVLANRATAPRAFHRRPTQRAAPIRYFLAACSAAAHSRELLEQATTRHADSRGRGFVMDGYMTEMAQKTWK